MPFTYGNSINLKDINYIVEKDEDLIELQPPKIGETERKIGEYCASLIKDGDTLQLGIGAILMRFYLSSATKGSRYSF